MSKTGVWVVIPAYNEEQAIGEVLAEIPSEAVDGVIVVNNASTDQTATKAKALGAVVLDEPQKGYGYACLRGIDFALKHEAEILVFLDGDHSDYPQQMLPMIELVKTQQADFVLGSRVMGQREQGSLTPQQVFGNALSSFLIKMLYGVSYTDLGPFRAIRASTLSQMNMQDKTYGWTVEMQLKAARLKVKTIEIPVDYRKRIGVSKVSGTLKGTLLAGYKILQWVFTYYFKKY